jgi:hypothetical protein
MTEPPNTSRSDACGRPIQCYSLASRKSVCRLATICSRPPKHNLKITRVPHGNPDATGPSADRLSALKSAMIGGVENPATATKCFAAARASANPNSSALAPNAPPAQIPHTPCAQSGSRSSRGHCRGVEADMLQGHQRRAPPMLSMFENSDLPLGVKQTDPGCAPAQNGARGFR